MRRSGHKATIDLVAALLLFCVYSGCVLICLMTGASVYRRTLDSTQAQFSGRTTLSYLAARVRAYNTAGGVSVTRFGDGDALVLADEAEAPYVTYVYCCSGQLCELYTDPALGLPPEAGEIIAPSAPMRVETIGRVLKIVLGEAEPIFVSLTSVPEVSR